MIIDKTLKKNTRFYLGEIKGRDKTLEQKRIECPICATKQRSDLEIGDKVTLYEGNIFYAIKDTEFKLESLDIDKFVTPLYKNDDFIRVRLREDVDADVDKVINTENSNIKFFRLCDVISAGKLLIGGDLSVYLRVVSKLGRFEMFEKDFLVVPSYYLVDEHIDRNSIYYILPYSYTHCMGRCNNG